MWTLSSTIHTGQYLRAERTSAQCPLHWTIIRLTTNPKPNSVLPHHIPHSSPSIKSDNTQYILPHSIDPHPSPSNHQPKRQTIPRLSLQRLPPLRLPNPEAKNQTQVPHRRHPGIHHPPRDLQRREKRRPATARLNLHLRPLRPRPRRRPRARQRAL